MTSVAGGELASTFAIRSINGPASAPDPGSAGATASLMAGMTAVRAAAT